MESGAAFDQTDYAIPANQSIRLNGYRRDLPTFWVNIGRDCIARSYGFDGAFEAVLAPGWSVGIFPTPVTARAALREARI